MWGSSTDMIKLASPYILHALSAGMYFLLNLAGRGAVAKPPVGLWLFVVFTGNLQNARSPCVSIWNLNRMQLFDLSFSWTAAFGLRPKVLTLTAKKESHVMSIFVAKNFWFFDVWIPTPIRTHWFHLFNSDHFILERLGMSYMNCEAPRGCFFSWTHALDTNMWDSISSKNTRWPVNYKKLPLVNSNPKTQLQTLQTNSALFKPWPSALWWAPKPPWNMVGSLREIRNRLHCFLIAGLLPFFWIRLLIQSASPVGHFVFVNQWREVSCQHQTSSMM